MKERLEALGWKMYYECNTCNGHKQYYANEAKKKYEIRVRLSSQTFSILLDNMIIAGPFWNYQLEEKIEKHVS